MIRGLGFRVKFRVSGSLDLKLASLSGAAGKVDSRSTAEAPLRSSTAVHSLNANNQALHRIFVHNRA